MTTWVNRREKTQNHSAYIKWRHENHQASPWTPTPDERLHCPRFLKMARNPTIKSVSFEELLVQYGTIDFQDGLADFIAHVNNPGASAVSRTRSFIRFSELESLSIDMIRWLVT
jgi:hypothetical protein